MNKAIASCLGIGFIKGGGTIAAAVFCLLIWLSWRIDVANFQVLFAAATLLIMLLGIYVGNRVEADWGKDSSRVVIDEAAGMMVSMIFLPHNIWLLIAGFVMFRFFDILKPLYIRRLEALPGGLGVMADDVLAGIYSNILLIVPVVIFKL
ncbi:phosphatidylglycerophosphatase A family protein [Mucilaginibacter ginkgonis]|uniref:Phosphatidylglycerophosphatase A n=1 Tax=Mucilaginibacter ginkgonis TaxID=2682091 RepID=A0A6I4HY52_9SPHI|nr:phosphatidylglycerophosphatase A [Mucilaginibacter ginkgonis]QQL49506.1 phosphatidylglycerophosphatase A [Mucilaginibacter ginkgonis]